MGIFSHCKKVGHLTHSHNCLVGINAGLLRLQAQSCVGSAGGHSPPCRPHHHHEHQRKMALLTPGWPQLRLCSGGDMSGDGPLPGGRPGGAVQGGPAPQG